MTTVSPSDGEIDALGKSAQSSGSSGSVMTGGGRGGAVVVVGGGAVVVVRGGGVVVAAAFVVSGGGCVATEGEVVAPTRDADETPMRLSAFEPRVVVTIGGDAVEAVGTGAGFAGSVRLGVADCRIGRDVGDEVGRSRWGSEVATPRSERIGGRDSGRAA